MVIHVVENMCYVRNFLFLPQWTEKKLFNISPELGKQFGKFRIVGVDKVGNILGNAGRNNGSNY